MDEVCSVQITKLPVVLDSLRKPDALDRTPVSVVGMLSWQDAPLRLSLENPDAGWATEKHAANKPASTA